VAFITVPAATKGVAQRIFPVVMLTAITLFEYRFSPGLLDASKSGAGLPQGR